MRWSLVCSASLGFLVPALANNSASVFTGTGVQSDSGPGAVSAAAGDNFGGTHSASFSPSSSPGYCSGSGSINSICGQRKITNGWANNGGLAGFSGGSANTVGQMVTFYRKSGFGNLPPTTTMQARFLYSGTLVVQAEPNVTRTISADVYAGVGSGPKIAAFSQVENDVLAFAGTHTMSLTVVDGATYAVVLAVGLYGNLSYSSNAGYTRRPSPRTKGRVAGDVQVELVSFAQGRGGADVFNLPEGWSADAPGLGIVDNKMTVDLSPDGPTHVRGLAQVDPGVPMPELRVVLTQGGVYKGEFTLLPDETGSFNQATGMTGTYDLEIWPSRFLRKTIPNVTLGSGPVDLPFSLVCGDIDLDNSVTVFDYIELSMAFDKDSTMTDWAADVEGIRPVDCDLDLDGSITVFDYIILSNSFDKSGD